MLSLRVAALSDIGRVRRENEDRYLCDEEQRIFGVADGVGGLPGGAEAAQMAVQEIARSLPSDPAEVEERLAELVQRASQAVASLGSEISPAMGIGSTLTFGYFHDGNLLIAHVGDSRCYLTRGGECLRLTEDHSVENEARMRRARGEVVYYHEANRNALTRCIGQPPPLEVDVVRRPVLPGDRYLFCTDGVTRMVQDSEIGTLLGTAATPKAALEAMVALALRRGGPDNATGVAVFVDDV